MILLNKVQELREKANMTVYELCKRGGFYSEKGVIVSRSIYRLEEGEAVKLEVAYKVFLVLKDAGVCERFEDVFSVDGFSISDNIEQFDKTKVHPILSKEGDAT